MLAKLKEKWESLQEAFDEITIARLETVFVGEFEQAMKTVKDINTKAAKDTEETWFKSLSGIDAEFEKLFGKKGLKKKIKVPDIFDPVTLQRSLRLIPGDIPGLEDETEDISREFEIALRPRFEGLEDAWKQITLTASNQEKKPAEKTADNTEETTEELKEIKKSSKKAEGFLAKTVELLGPIKDALTPLTINAEFAD